MEVSARSITTSFSDIWTAQFMHVSDWLEDGKHTPDDKRYGEQTQSGFDTLSADAPTDQCHWNLFQSHEMGF